MRDFGVTVCKMLETCLLPHFPLTAWKMFAVEHCELAAFTMLFPVVADCELTAFTISFAPDKVWKKSGCLA